MTPHPLRRTALVLTLAPFTAFAQTAPDRPNIVVFLVDDLGWQETSVPFHTEVTALNRRYRTPNLEALAAEGVKFTQAYASAVCSPSRVSLLTGMNAARHRVTNWTLRKDASPDTPLKGVTPPAWNVNGLRALAPGETLPPETDAPAPGRFAVATPLPELLRAAGYRTIHCGKAHFGALGTPGEDPRALGFEVNIAGHAAGGPGSYLGEKNYSAAWRTSPPDHVWDVPGLDAYKGTTVNLTEALTLEAVKAMDAAVAAKQPFFLHLAHYAVHVPWEDDARFIQKYRDAGLKGTPAALASMIEGMDKSLGDVRAALRRLGVEKNTVILFLSDNGSPSQCPANLPLRGHKCFPYEGGTRVPMIAYRPGVTPAGTVCRTPVLIEDVFPTVLALAGADGKPAQPVDGVSFVAKLAAPAAADPAAAARPLVWHSPNHYGYTPFSAIRIGDRKLIHHHVSRKLELYDLAHDLEEQHDLAARHPELTRQLAAALTRTLRDRHAQMPLDAQTGAPLPFADAIAR